MSGCSEALAAIRALHQPVWVSDAAKAAGKDPWVCVLCGVSDGHWPCETRMIVDEALGKPVGDAATGEGQ